MITVNPFSVELIRVNYDVEAAADALRRRGAPESYAQMLLRGLSLEKIIAEDEAKQNDMEEKCGEVTRSSQIILQTYWPDTNASGASEKAISGTFRLPAGLT